MLHSPSLFILEWFYRTILKARKYLVAMCWSGSWTLWSKGSALGRIDLNAIWIQSVLKCITSANTAHIILLLKNFGTISVNGRGETLKHHNSHQNLQVLWLRYFLNNGNKLITNIFISRRRLPFDYKKSERKTSYTVQISEYTHEALQWAHWVQPLPHHPLITTYIKAK